MEPVEKFRLSRQCQAILTRLEVGRASNRELSGIALKYTSRISDLRDHGWNVQMVEEDRASGLNWYALVPVSTAVPQQVELFGEVR